jgi:hypothetical protein
LSTWTYFHSQYFVVHINATLFVGSKKTKHVFIQNNDIPLQQDAHNIICHVFFFIQAENVKESNEKLPIDFCVCYHWLSTMSVLNFLDLCMLSWLLLFMFFSCIVVYVAINVAVLF